MRSATKRSDGSLEISKSDRMVADLARYLRFKHGESIIDIAQSEGTDPEAVKISVRKGRNMYEAEQILKLRDLKHTALIETEEIRRDIRRRISKQLVDSVERLLQGKRTVVEVNKLTGEVTLHEIVDPEVISMGIEHARKSISLDEKPAANQTTVNIQQNNGAGDGSISVESSYEQRLARIRARQIGPASQRVIDVQADEVSESEPAKAVEAEIVEDAKAEDKWGF